MKRKSLFYLFMSLLLISGLIQPTTIYAAWNKPHYQLIDMYYSVASNGTYTFAVGRSGAMKFGRDSGQGFNGSLVSPFNVDLNEIINVNGEFMIVGGNGLIAKYVPLSPHTIYDSNTTSVLSGIAYGNGHYVAVGQFSTVVTSSDRVTWTSKILGEGEFIYDVTFGDIFIAVAQHGKIWSSENGETWTERESNVTNYIQAVTYGGGQYVAVGASGTVITSPDGITWTKQESGLANNISLNGIAYANSTYVAVGSAGSIITSTDGVNWIIEETGTLNTLSDVIAIDNSFLIVGDRINLLYADSIITYHGNGNSGGTVPIDSGEYVRGDVATVLENSGNLTRTGYTFAGWNTAANGTGTSYTAGATLTLGSTNVTLYAQWTPIPKYSVTYDGNNNTSGTVPTDSGSYESGAVATIKGNTGNLVKTGYTFGGWNTAADGTGTSYATGATLTLGSTNVMLYAQWTPIPKYSVTYDGNNNSSGTVPTDSGSYESGAVATIKGNTGNLVKTGYTFGGWNTAADGTGTSYATGATLTLGSTNVTLYAQWTPIPKYSVTYDGNNNTSGTVPTDSGSYESGSTTTVAGNSGNLTRTGYTFGGWNTAADGTGTSYAAGATLTLGSTNVTLYAQWTPIPKYSVTYDGNNSTSGIVPTDSGSYESGAVATIKGNTGNLVKTGYTFAGWNTAANGTGTSYAAGATLTLGSTNVTLYAQWAPIPKYSVTYDGNNSTSGTVPTDSGSYESGAVATIKGNTGNLTRTGYTFGGWNTAADGTGTSYTAGATLTLGITNVMLYAQWTPIPKYSVTYDGNNNTSGTVPTDSGSYESGSTTTVAGNSGNLTRTGYTFGGWNTVADGTGTSYAAGATLTLGITNVMLYAQWTPIPKYSVTYDGNDSTSGTVPTDSGSYESGAVATIKSNTGNLVKTGYTFAGWNTAANGTGTSYAAGATLTLGSTNVTLYAQWAPIPKYSVTYDGNNSTSGTVPTDSGSYESGAVATIKGNSGNLTRTGYTFGGWNTAADGTGTSYTAGATLTLGSTNVTLYAQWTPIPKYSVTYDGNNSTSGTVPTDSGSYESGAEATIKSNTGNLVKTGYTFGGWNTVADGTGTSYTAGATLTLGSTNVTLYAQWTPIPKYSVTYDGNNNSSGTVPTDSGSYESGAVATIKGNTGNLTRTGYTFGGWNTAADGTGTSYTAGATLTLGSTNVTLYAQWTPVPKYSVTYDGNNSTSGIVPTDSGSYESGAVATIKGNTGNLVKTGYTFAGWNTAANGTGTSYAAGATLTLGSTNVTLYAQWAPIPKYSVTYDGNNSTSGTVPTDSGSYESGAVATIKGNTGNLTRTGYTFGGWNTAADGTGTSYTAGATLTLGITNVMLYAQWTPIPKYSVTYDGNNNTSGTVPTDSGSYESGSTTTVAGNSGNLTKTGYTFAGWNTAADGTGTSYTAGTTLTLGSTNVTLYAQWTPIPKYSVTYDGNNNTSGTVPTDSGSYESGAVATIKGNTGNLVKTGYTFAGWNTAANGTGTSYATGATLTLGSTNVTLYAQWTPIPKYSVTYDGNNSTSGTVPTDSGSYESGAVATIKGNSGNLTRTGYTFGGWNTAADGTGTSYAAGATLTLGITNVTLYAQWSPIPKYSVTYDGNNNTSGIVPTDSGSYESGAVATIKGNTGNLVKTGYTFAGWNTAANGTGTSYAAGATLTLGSTNVTLYAQWTPIPKYSVTYDGNNNTSGIVPTDSGSYESGSTTTVAGNSGNLTNTGYTFAGWNTAADGTGTSYAAGATLTLGSTNVTLYAQWTPIPKYSVTYDGNNNTSGTVPTDSGSYESGAVATIKGNTGNLVKTGYTFAGWNTAADGTGTSYTVGTTLTLGSTNVTLYAQWKNSSSSSTSEPTIIQSTGGRITLPVGTAGNVSLDNLIKVNIPTGAANQELTIGIEKKHENYGLLLSKGIPISKVFEITKNISDELQAQLTISLALEATKLSKEQQPGVYIFDEALKDWVEVGNVTVDGNWITIQSSKVGVFTVLCTQVIDGKRVLCEPASTLVTPEFTDISGHWAEANIKTAIELKIINGYPNGTIKPNNHITRAEFVVMLSKALQFETKTSDLNFVDADSIPSWARPSVMQAVEAGSINGYTDGSFRANANITRGEIAVMLVNVLHITPKQILKTGFRDDELIPIWVKNAAEYLRSNGIMQGNRENLFNSKDHATRAEAITAILRILNKLD